MRFVILSVLVLLLSPQVGAEVMHGSAERQNFTVTSVKKDGNTKFFAKKPWEGLFSAKKFGRNDLPELTNIEALLKAAIIDLPTSHTAALKKLEVRNQQNASRGLANSKMIILNTDSISSSDELQAVFTHEMGHVVDLGMLKPNGRTKSAFWTEGTQVFVGDPSIDFYTLSWTDYNSRKQVAKRGDFISGYAMSSPYEDFAESYVFYRLHGEKFRSIAAESEILQAKYNFIKNRVFKGQEYQKEKHVAANFLHNVIWDATLVKF